MSRLLHTEANPTAERRRKETFSDLAIAGGVPAFRECLHVGRPNIGDRTRLMARIADMLDRRWLTNNGPYVQEFEARICEELRVAHCVALSNGTAALEMAVRALELSGEVIVPSFTFVATPHALQWLGLKPVFCDVDPRTHTLDPSRIEERITESTTGIVSVHLWGQPSDVEALARIADRHRIRIVYDAAHAFGCSHQGRMVGGFGEAEILSFHATKFVNAFEGGAVVTNNRDLADRIRLMRNFGFSSEDHVVSIGTNAKMSEVSAAMGLTSLEGMDEVIRGNQEKYRRYQERLSGLSGVRLLPLDDRERRNYQYVVLEVDSQAVGISRDDLVAVLRAENIRARRYFFPGCHWVEPYRTLYPESIRFLPVTERLAAQVMCLPTGTALSTDDVDTVCDVVRLSVAEAPALGQLMRGVGAALG